MALPIEGVLEPMSDRGFLFLFSLLMIAAGVASVGYLVATGQAGTVDGLFLTLTALLLTVCFALYVIYVIRRAMEAAKPKTAATPSPAKAAPAQS